MIAALDEMPNRCIMEINVVWQVTGLLFEAAIV